MTPEDRLRRALEAHTSHVEPSTDALSHIKETLMTAKRDDDRTRWTIGLGSAAAIIAIVVGVVVLTSGDGDDTSVVADSSTTSTTALEETTTTEASETTTTTTAFASVDPATPVFPDPATSRRFDSPEAVAQAFATDLVGFEAPILGDFQQGDTRSGEIEVRAFAEGAPTVVAVRQLEDDTWFVIAASTESIELAVPAFGEPLSSPQALEGRAHAFEGTVNVRLFADGTSEPIAETFVTGRGDGVLGDFTGELTFTAPAGATHGVLVLSSGGGESGAPIAALVVRVEL